MMNFKIASLLILFNFALCLGDVTDYYCDDSNWVLSSLTSVTRCFQKLPSVFRASLTDECNKIGGFPVNIDTYEHGAEVIAIMKHFKYYGIWVDARKLENSEYQWVDGRPAPSPISWCPGISKQNLSTVILCPYPKVETYSISTCCLSDRHERTKFVAICETIARTDCQYVENKRLRPDCGCFNLISSTILSVNDSYKNEECGQLCAGIKNCSVFELNYDTSTCYFYEKKIRVKDISMVTVKSTRSWLAGALYARLDK